MKTQLQGGYRLKTSRHTYAREEIPLVKHNNAGPNLAFGLLFSCLVLNIKSIEPLPLLFVKTQIDSLSNCDIITSSLFFFQMILCLSSLFSRQRSAQLPQQSKQECSDTWILTVAYYSTGNPIICIHLHFFPHIKSFLGLDVIFQAISGKQIH